MSGLIERRFTCFLLIFFSFGFVSHEFQHFLTTSHIIAISSRVRIEYVTNGDNKEVAMIGAVAGKGTTSAPPTEIVGSRVGRVSLGPSCDE